MDTELFKLMFDGSGTPAYIIHVLQDDAGNPCDFEYVYSNDANLKMRHRTRGQLLGIRALKNFPNTPAKWLRVYAKCAFSDEVLTFSEYWPSTGEYVRFTIRPMGRAGYCFVTAAPPIRTSLEMINPQGENTEELLKLREEKSILDALCANFVTADLIDIKANTITPIKQNPFSHRGSGMYTDAGDAKHCFTDWISMAWDNIVVHESVPDFPETFDADNLMRRLDEHSYFTYRYETTPDESGHRFFEVQVVKLFADNESYQVVAGYRPIDDVIAEENERNQALADALDAAKDASVAKSNFLFNMSHDIRTPLNAIVGFSELIERHAGDETRVLDYASKIRSSTDYLQSLINNVLDMAQIESGKYSLDLTVASAIEFSESISDTFDHQMELKNITFTHSFNFKHEYFWTDVMRLREVMSNILSNAVKYTMPGGHISYSVIEESSDDPEIAIMRAVISDDGIGMTPEFLEHLFEHFTRERTTTESGEGGTGLGMAITKELVEAMNGTIEVESELGAGTTFTVCIPHRIASKAELEETPTLTVDPEEFKGKRLLLAEDNDLNAEIAVTILEESGFLVERASDGVECVGMLEDAEVGYYDAILMDIQMPNMDGYKATHVIRHLPCERAKTPIIAMTANAFAEDRQRSLEAGMDAHVSKPIDLTKLREALTQVL